jgi:hypothetical protein
MSYKGKFVPKNPQRYKGDWSKITYRSSWEKYIMEMLDTNDNVRYWQSEETVIPYFSNADGRKRRYFMDFTICWSDGSIHLWEVKPKKEVHPPIPPSKMTTAAKKRFINEIYTHTVNTDKWRRTAEICAQKGWSFKIITEDALKRFGFKGLER